MPAPDGVRRKDHMSEGKHMTDHDYSRVPRRLAIAAVAIGLLQFVLFLLGRVASAGSAGEALTLQAFGGATVLLLVVVKTIAAVALAGLVTYCRAHGYLERRGGAGRGSPLRLTMLFTAALLLLTILWDVFVQPLEIGWLLALLAQVTTPGTETQFILLAHILNVLDFIQIVLCCLLAFAIMLGLSRRHARAAVPAASGPSGSVRAGYACDPARVAALALALAVYTAMAWEIRLVWPLLAYFLTELTPGLLALLTLAAVVTPAIPAVLCHAAARPVLERLRLARARPARAVAAAVISYLLLAAAKILLGVGIALTHTRLLRSGTSWMVFSAVVTLAFVIALAPLCRVMCRVLYRVDGAGAGPDAMAPGQVA
jgi:hypothetical protein